MRMRMGMAGLWVLGWQLACAAATTASAPMGELMEFPHAGVAIAAPSDYVVDTPRNATDVLQAVQMDKDRPIRSITLVAIPVGPDETTNTFCDRVIADLRKNLAFRNIKELKQTTMPIAGLTASARLLSYTLRGYDYVAAQACFIRDIESPKLRLAYLLSVELIVSRQDQLVANLRDVANSIKLIPLRQASQLPVEKLEKPLEDGRLGYSIRPPMGWFVRPAQDGMLLGQADFVLGRPVPSLQVVVQKTPALTTSRDVLLQFLQAEKEFAEKSGVTVQAGEQTAVTLAGLAGSQAACVETAKGDGGAGEMSMTVFFRVTSLHGAPGQPGRAYGLRLMTAGKDTQAAEALMDKLAGGFSLLTAASAPAASGPDKPATSGSSPKAHAALPIAPAATPAPSEPSATAPAPPVSTEPAPGMPQ